MSAQPGPASVSQSATRAPEVHPTAIVEDGAQLGPGVVIGSHCLVGPRVTLGPRTVLHHGAVVTGKTTLGADNEVFPYAVLGTVPQDLKYQGEETELVFGDQNAIREYVTVNIGTESGGGITKIGNKNLLMANVHIGHDCIIGDHCVLATGTGLAGHVILEDWVILGGHTGVHQFVRFGTHCMTGGGAKVNKDVLPFAIAQGYPARLRGINHIGLRRRGFSNPTIRALKQAYRTVFRPEVRFEEAVEQIRAEFQASVEVGQMMDFLERSLTGRGFMTPVWGEGDQSESQAEE